MDLHRHAAGNNFDASNKLSMADGRYQASFRVNLFPPFTMRFSAAFAALWSLAAGSTYRGHVFLIDPDTSLSAARHDTIDPTTARLIFAQRLGLSPFYDIGHVDEDA